VKTVKQNIILLFTKHG